MYDVRIFKYAYLNISKKIFINFIIMIQAAAICFLFYSVMDVNKKISDEADKILNVFNGKKAWYMKNSSEFHYRFFDGTMTPDRILEAYKTVKNRDFIHFYLDDDFSMMKKFEGMDNFIANPSSKVIDGEEYLAVKGFNIDKDMNNQFTMKFISGTGFEDKDFEAIQDLMPVVLGYDYRDTYKPGDIIPYFDPVTSKIKKYIVRGILEEDTSLLYKINTHSTFLNLNSSIVKPFIDLDKLPKNELMTTYNTQVFNFFNTSYFLFDASKSDEDIKSIVNSINNKFSELKIGKQDITTADKYLALNKEMLLAQKKNSETLSIIVTLFLSIGITSSMMYSIKREKSQIGIHILSGATLNDISLTVFVQNFMIMCVGAIASLGFIKAKYSSINAMFLMYILILILIIAIITSITPIRVIRKLNVNELIRSGE